jgi:hypothetical protein
VFENRVLRRIHGPKRDEVTGEWRKLHNEELHILYSSPDIVRQISQWDEVGRACGMHVRGKKIVHGFSGKKPKGKRPFGRPRRSFLPLQINFTSSRTH